MRRRHVLALIALTAVAALVGVGSANAAQTDPFVYKSSFGESLGIDFGQIQVNHQTGNVLVAGKDGFIYQFDASGNPVEFPAAGSFRVPGAPGQFEIDNSGGPTQGNFYVLENLTYLRSYHADGSPIGESSTIGEAMGPGIYQPAAEESGGPPIPAPVLAIGVDPDGTLWIFATGDTCLPAGGGCNTSVHAMTPEAVQTGVVYQTPPVISITSGFSLGAFDKLGNAYVTSTAIERLDASSGFAALGGSGLLHSMNFQSPTQGVINPATNELYAAMCCGAFAIGFQGTVLAVGPESTSSTTPTEVLRADRGIARAFGVAFDATGQTLYLSEFGKVRIFRREPASPPRDLTTPLPTEIRSGTALIKSTLIDGGADTTYRFEYGTTTSYGGVSKALAASRWYYSVDASGAVEGLAPDTTYHVRVAATNAAGTSYGPDVVIKTYPMAPGTDTCPNALARKQTSAQRLPDCRAYELVSASDTGGYDVESYLAPGQTPFPGFPMATDKLLYATHSGAVPGPWNATNKGPDPYLATRTASGWVTDYKGMPSNLNSETSSFSSVLGEADSQLNTLAFAGPNLCDPCFTSGGLRTGIPVRLPSNQLVQGMSGSLAASVPDTAKPEGKVAKYFSGDGKHLIFASKYAFEPGANTGGDLTVYDRNLATGQTQIASTDQAGNPLTGTVSELDVSSNGSRIISATKVGEDAAGNEYVHPYLHIGSSPNSVDLAPGTTTGVLYAGMSSDGSKVFFTSADKLLAGDSDTSADLYEGAVDSSGTLDLSLVSESNSDACNPVANSGGEHWNTTGSAANCDAVAISGGGGVASQSGAIYFLSPESFGGEGSANQPNLYLAESGDSPSFVATLEADNPLVLDSVKANAVRRTGDFQTTPSGNYAVLTSDLGLSGIDTHGYRSVFRFTAGSGQLECGSCDMTGTTEASVFAAAELPPNGLALLADGRFFFTTAAQLAVNDANGKKDVYEWSGGGPQLISPGSGPFATALLTASADGTDVFFFTHDVLAPEEDKNGSLMKVYDAREGGGFFKLPPPVPCAASDECHGPGTPPPGPADIKSSGKTTPGNVLVCPKNRVKKRGKCVKKPVRRKKKQARKKGAAKKRAAGMNGKRGGRNA